MKNQDILDTSSPLSSDKNNILKSLIKDLSSSQLSWLSGYFWALGSNQSSDCKTLKDIHNNFQVTIVSASQTGNAKGLSELLLKECIDNNINARLFNASDYPIKKIQNEKILICIVSTHGEGEPPEEAIEFYDFLMSNSSLNMKKTYFSVFGLGDKSYNLFCQAAKNLDKKLLELGGISLLERVDSDVDYFDQATIWRKNLLDKIKNIFSTVNQDVLNDDQNYSFKNQEVIYNKYNPAIGIVTVNQKLTGRNSSKDVRHIEIIFKDSKIKYNPGDALGVWYENDDDLVKEILSLLNIQYNQLVHFKNQQMSIHEVLKKNFELTLNTIVFFNKYIHFTKNTFLHQIKNDRQKILNYVNCTSIIDMIRFSKPCVDIKVDQLLDFFRPLSPRLYSISSSSLECNNEIHITVKIIKYFYLDRLRFGGASKYLSNSLKKYNQIRCFVVKNNNFRLPNDKDSIIMVASGTGIAPFRAFMQERSYNQSIGKNWIFFGNTNFTEDFLYQLEWMRYLRQGILHKIDLSWSRDFSNVVYVQDKILENGLEIWNWVKNGAYIYICGDAKKMAVDVELAFLNVFSRFGNMNILKSKEFLHKLRSKRRYQRDVY
ncbi:assimilatory sulfite reductase (NADPH) flavoprotein subunit [Buchnera aphidicola]|uniref:assimilatory sulfite reductase (NADPH) flavoprotein subunit n=1 Tax=Buchnera aphidicola TaxID=9 RepID=UPI00346470E8